jgi:DNA modification methylase
MTTPRPEPDDRDGDGPQEVPLAVWPCAQATAQRQRAGVYLPECREHPGKMLPDLARRIVRAYSRPGDVVVDPMCGTGTTLVEAARLGRRAIGVDLEERWVDLAARNLDRILDTTTRPNATVRIGDARRLPDLLPDVAGRVDLIATSPPYMCDAGVIDKPAWIAGARMCDHSTLNYSGDAANLGHARGDEYRAAMAAVYSGCHAVLRPGGLLVTVTKNMRRHGRLVDLAAITRRLASDVGFGYLQHVVALHAGIRDSQLVGRPSFWQLSQVRRARAAGHPIHLVAHEDALVFHKITPEGVRCG